jgi:hypothetical protein
LNREISARYTLDSKGNLIGTATSSSGGTVNDVTLEGSGTVNSDCTGTLSVGVYASGSLVRTANFDGAESIRKLIKKLGPVEKLRACYEAGPTGYVVYWQLAELGVKCDSANFGTSEGRRSSEDGSARCREAGA